MTTGVTAHDAKFLTDALNRLRSDEAIAGSYVLVDHHEANTNVIQLQAAGQGVDELASQLDETKVQYALIKMTEQFDIATTHKFVLIRWIGDKVPFSKKGRYGIVFGAVNDQFFSPSHAQLETSFLDDVTHENINKLVQETSGNESKVVENAQAAHMVKRGFTAVPATQPPKSKSNIIPVSRGGAEVRHGDDVTEAIAKVRSDDSSTTWACIGYEANDVKKPLQCIATGQEADVEAMKGCLEDDRPLYFLYRTSDTIDSHVTVKFVYIIWVGELVKPMAKAKLSTHKGVVQELFSGCHVTLFATNKSEISASIILDKVQSASGTKSNVK
ncbi:uncharacterized protein [Watersipora subatra]|uniref:uncharacterized protein n=1 Tax=Watersipora subatra TaxID=2589382 RepID=UPI00355B45C5